MVDLTDTICVPGTFRSKQVQVSASGALASDPARPFFFSQTLLHAYGLVSLRGVAMEPPLSPQSLGHAIIGSCLKM